MLIDTGRTGNVFIGHKLVNEICDLLEIAAMPLAKSKRVRGFGGRISKNSISYALYPSLSLPNHSKFTASMLNTDLGQHAVMLSKPWMNRFGVLFGQVTFVLAVLSMNSLEADYPDAVH